MAALTYYIAITLDGFISDPDGGFGFFPGEGDHLAALATRYPETFPAPFRERLGIADAPNRHFDTVVMGRHTYQPALDAGLTSPYPHLDQYVVSTTLGPLHDAGVHVIDDDPAERVRSLKREEERQGIWLCGGGVLAGALLDEIDELVLKTNPVVVGDGRPLVARPFAPHTFAHVGGHTYDSGVTVHHYRRRP